MSIKGMQTDILPATRAKRRRCRALMGQSWHRS